MFLERQKRTLKKKLSIDVVWKLAKLFGLSLEEMIESRTNIPHDNTGILTAFIKKLLLLTKTNKMNGVFKVEEFVKLMRP